jgi:hypothetical protein
VVQDDGKLKCRDLIANVKRMTNTHVIKTAAKVPALVPGHAGLNKR